MKKSIKSMLILAVAAMTIASCDDIPAPYEQPKTSNDQEPSFVEPTGDGTIENPFNIAAAKNYIATGGDLKKEVYVKGFISEIEQIDLKKGSATYHFSDDGKSKYQLKIYGGTYTQGKKFTSKEQIVLGDTIIIAGKLVNFNGTYEFTAGNKIVFRNGKWYKPEEGGNATGNGTQASPYNVSGVIAKAKTLGANDKVENVYATGIISQIVKFDAVKGQINYYISDDGQQTTQFYVYGGLNQNGTKFTSENDLQVGQKVTIIGTLLNYKGNVPQFQYGNKIINLGGGSTPPAPASNEMTIEAVQNGKVGSVALLTGKFGSQSTTDENTWYSWAFNNVTYKGVKLAVSDGKYGEGLQVQGHASDATKQGFFFNATAFDKDIKTVTLVISVKDFGASTYAPSYTFYAGTAAHPTTTEIAGTSSNVTEGGYKIFTEVYDLSTSSYKYFTLANNKIGTVCVKKMIVELK